MTDYKLLSKKLLQKVVMLSLLISPYVLLLHLVHRAHLYNYLGVQGQEP